MMKQTLLKLAQKNSFFGLLKKIYQATRNTVRSFYYSHQRIDKKLVVFEAFRSKKYADSPKTIYEYMLHSPEYKDFRFIWAFEDPKDHKEVAGPRTRLVKHESHGYFTAFARSKYWVVNGWISLDVKKRPDQIMLQCWHGTPLKKLRHDISTSIATEHQRNALKNNDSDAERFDYFISPSKFATKVFTSAFNLKELKKQDIIIETGYPRNDFLVNITSQQIKRLRKQYNIPEDKKVLLYAPTWRDDQHVENEGYFYKSPVDFHYLKDRLANEYVLLFRAHNLVDNTFDFDAYDGFVRDVSGIDDVNDLYVISDVLMTDYSSVFFDYANLRRPIIFFMYDLEHYQKDLRGFYLDLKGLPGDIVKTEPAIVKILSDLDTYNKNQAKNYQDFHDKFNYLDDGKAAERVVERVFKGQ